MPDDTPPAAVRQRAEKVLAALRKRYPHPTSQLTAQSPWELLVATILAAQCTDVRVNGVTPTLFARWPGPAELATATQKELEAVIRPTGFYHNKATNLLRTAKLVTEKFGGEVPKTMEDLMQLAGVARKTANIVLYGGYGIIAGLAVDTHVKRIAHRLGLTRATDPNAVERDLTALFPRQEWGKVNHRMVWFGRDVCRARSPMCGQCEMSGFCPKREP
ncbi:MAG: endonuclease III [Desulfovibrio sp.]|jgi:endonuclease-3|nr:endonuclease III [Desulfovibrio sp.]